MRVSWIGITQLGILLFTDSRLADLPAAKYLGRRTDRAEPLVAK